MITWINCSERMPPDDDETEIIVETWTCNHYRIKAWILHMESALLGKENYKWVPYTPEAWSELNKS